VLVMGMPLFDTSLVIFTRLREGRSIVRGAKDHTSHRLAILGFSQRQAVITHYGACIVLGLIALVISQTSVTSAELISAITAFIALGLFVFLLIVRSRDLKRQKQANASVSMPQP